MSPVERRIYFASRTRHAAKWLLLRAQRFPVSCTWIDEAGPGETTDYGDLMRRCIEEASHATAIIVYAEGDDIAGWKGVWFELGAALSHGVPAFFVGTHDFPSALRHPGVTCCDSLEDAMALALVPRTIPRTPVPSEAAIKAAAKVFPKWEPVPMVSPEQWETFLREVLSAAYAVDRPAVPGEPQECPRCGTGDRRLWCGAARPYPDDTRAHPSAAGGCQVDFAQPWWMHAYRCGDCGAWFHKRCLATHIGATGERLEAPAPDHTGLLRELREAVGKWGALMWSDGEASQSPADPWSDETNAAWARLATLLDQIEQTG